MTMFRSQTDEQLAARWDAMPFVDRVIDLAAWDCYINDKFVIRKNTERAANTWLRKNSHAGNSWRRVEL